MPVGTIAKQTVSNIIQKVVLYILTFYAKRFTIEEYLGEAHAPF